MRSYLLFSFLLGGCASSASPTADSGTTSTPDVVERHDVTSGMTRDVISISFSETGVSLPDATADATSKRDVVAPPAEGGSQSDGSLLSDAAKDAQGADAHDSDEKDSEAKDSEAKDAGTKDTGTKDTGLTCTPVTVPTSTEGLTMCTPASGSCAPGNTSSFTPTAASPAAPATGTCKAGQLTALYNGCLGDNASDTACTNAAMPNEACYDCVFTNAGSTSGASWGPVVAGMNQLVNLNVGGCLQLLEPCNAPCAQAFVDNLECQLAACETNCSVSMGTQQEITAFGNCSEAADNCLPPSCGKYGVETECADSLTGPDHPGSVCFSDPNFDLTSFVTIASLFCGGS